MWQRRFFVQRGKAKKSKGKKSLKWGAGLENNHETLMLLYNDMIIRSGNRQVQHLIDKTII